jgi:hypothetical protein
VSGASIRDRVITADVLENALGESANGMRRINIAAAAVLTPSARDWLRSREIEFSRGTAAAARDMQSKPWLAVVLQSTAALGQALDDVDLQAAPWKKEITDCPEGAVVSVTRGIASKELSGAAVFTATPAAIACGINRHREARAVVVESAGCVQRAAREMAANAFCINAEGKTYLELRNMLRAIGAAETNGTAPKWMS